MIDDLRTAYTQATTEFKKTPQITPSGAKVNALFQAMQKVLHPEATASGVDAIAIDVQQVKSLHDAFIKTLSPEQQQAFIKVEHALEQGLQLPKTAEADKPLAEFKDEAARMKEIGRLTALVGTAKALEPLQKLEFAVWKLLENQSGVALSEPEKNAVDTLLKKYSQAVKEAYSGALKGCKNSAELVEIFGETAGFYNRMKPYFNDKTGPNTCVGIFWDKAEALLGAASASAVAQAVKKSGDAKSIPAFLKAKEEAYPLYEMLCAAQHVVKNANPDRFLAMQNEVALLETTFGFQDRRLVARVKGLGEDALLQLPASNSPAARTASKTVRVAVGMMAAVSFLNRAMNLHQAGKSPQEILTITAAELTAPLAAHVAKRYLPQKMHLGADIAAFAAGQMIAAKMNSADQQVAPLSAAGAQTPPAFNFPMTPLNATRPAADLPVSALPPGYPGVTPSPSIDMTAGETSWMQGLANQIADVAGPALHTAYEYSGKALVAGAMVVSVFVKSKTGTVL